MTLAKARSGRFMGDLAQKSSSIGFPVPTMQTGRPEASGKCRSRGMSRDR